MLGSLIGIFRWSWTIWGKHPSAGDYLSGGLSTQVERAISGWIQEGYDRLNVKEGDARISCAWRFWTQATGRHAIACGIIIDSSDRLGRPYPLLIMGTGNLKGWERCWEYLPVVLEGLWRRMEELSAFRTERFADLEQALVKFDPPRVDWSNLKKDPLSVNNEIMTSRSQTKDLPLSHNEYGDQPLTETHQIFPLKGDTVKAAMEWHQRIKGKCPKTPNALFMGGPVAMPYLAVFTRPLLPSDFVRLWTLESSMPDEAA